MFTNKNCRICLENALDSEFYDIFGDMDGRGLLYNEFIEEISHIRITKDDNLPQLLCKECANSLKGILNFIKAIQTTNEQLRKESNWLLGVKCNSLDVLLEEEETKVTMEEFLGDYNNENEDSSVIEEIHIIAEEEVKASSTLVNQECLNDECTSVNLTSVAVPKLQSKQLTDELFKEEGPLEEQFEQHNEDLHLELTTDSIYLVKCDKCEKELKSKNLHKHLAVRGRKCQKHQAVGYLCAYCPREFKSTKSLQHHEKIHQSESDDVVYICGDCERQYATEHQLENHRKQAHKERDNVCTICGNAFKLKNQLMNHMKLHLEKNINCPQCDKKYARQFDLNVHLRTHTGELPYACHLCDKRFAIKVRLTYHLQKHYGIKHRCKECSAEFNSKQKLKAHSFKHTGMPYRCELCDNHGFPTRNVFKRHLTRVHNTSMSDEALVEMFQRNTGKTIKIKQVKELDIIQIGEYEADLVEDEKYDQ